MKKLISLFVIILCCEFASAQVEFPKFKYDSLHYKIDTSSSNIYVTAKIDIYNEKLIRWSNHWWIGEITVMPGYKDLKVFIHENEIVKTYDYRVELEKYYKPAKAENLAHLRQLQTKYGKQFGEYIYHETPLIGMTSKMVALCIGYPTKINTTKLKNLTREQWVYVNKYDKYESSYYYFDNGRLTAIQD